MARALPITRLALKMMLAGTLAWWVCTLLGQPRPLFAVLVPLVAMNDDPFAAVNASAGRIVGVFAGVLLGLAVLHVHLGSTAVVALLLAVSLAAGTLLRVGEGELNNQVAITATFMFYLGVADRAEAVGVARIWVAAVGAAVAVAVAALLWPPDPLAETRRRVATLQAWLCADLRTIAGVLADPRERAAADELGRVRGRSRDAVRYVLDLKRAERALRLNPRRRTDAAALAEQARRLTGAARQYRHVRTLARLAADAAARRSIPASERAQLAGNTVNIAEAIDGQTPVAGQSPTLTDPLAIATAVKLGEMADDLREQSGRRRVDPATSIEQPILV